MREFEHYQILGEQGAVLIREQGQVIGRTSSTVTLKTARNCTYCVENERVFEGRRDANGARKSRGTARR